MSKTGKIIVWVVVVILIIWAVSSMNSSKNDSGTTVKIGAILPLTGDAAAYGEPSRNTFLLAVDEINKVGGINGKPIELIIEDGKCNGKDSSSAAQKLVNVDKVQMIIGGFCSGESLAAVPVAESAKVMLLSAASSSPDLTGKSKYFARNYPSDSSQGKILAKVAYTDKGYKNVAFIQEQTDYAVGLYKSFNDSFTQFGGATNKEEFASTMTDFRSQLSKLKAGNPDALFIDAQTPASAERIVKQVKELGWKVQLFISDGVLGDPSFLKNNASSIEGALGAEFGVDLNNAKFQSLANSYKAKYNTELPYQSYMQTVYDAVYMTAEGIKTVGNDGTKLSKWFRNVKDWDGASGKITIGSDGDLVGGHRPEFVKNGKMELYTK